VWSGAEHSGGIKLTWGAAREERETGPPVFFPLSLSADLAAVALAPFPAILSEEGGAFARPRAPERSERRADLTADSTKCLGDWESRFALELFLGNGSHCLELRGGAAEVGRPKPNSQEGLETVGLGTGEAGPGAKLWQAI
jgi:hypothetical protein